MTQHKKKGTGWIIAGAVMFTLAMAFMFMGNSLYGVSVDEFDSWALDPQRSEGDEITVTGKINEEVKLEFDEGDFYGYTFEDSECPFTSSEDLGNPGDTITVNLKHTGFLIQASSTPRIDIFWIMVFIFFVAGGGLILSGAMVRKRSRVAHPPELEHIRPYTPPPSPTSDGPARFQVVPSGDTEMEVANGPLVQPSSDVDLQDRGTYHGQQSYPAASTPDDRTSEDMYAKDDPGDIVDQDEMNDPDKTDDAEDAESPYREEGYAYLECPACSGEFRLSHDSITKRRIHIRCPHCNASGHLDAESLGME